MGPYVLLFLLPLLLLVLPAPAQEIPALPEVPLDTFPPAAREALAGAFRDAAARPDDPDTSGALGRLLHAWEQWEAAHGAYARAQALAPRTFTWHYLDAVVLQRLARHEEAAARLRVALAIDPTCLTARLRLAETLFDAGALDESRPLFEQLVAEPPSEPAARVGLGRLAAIAGRHVEAIAHFERAVALFPELGAAHYGLARAYRAAGRLAEAERAGKQHAAYGARWPRLDDPVLDAVTGMRSDARALLQRGVSLAQTGDLAGAIEAHDEALAADPGLAQAHANLISLRGRAGDPNRAEEHYRAAVALGMDEADLHYDYGVVLGSREEWPRAADAYRRALAVNPQHAFARNNLGQMLERERAFDAARMEYMRAVEAQPAFRLARFNLARMLLVLGDPAQAIAELTQIQEPRDAETPRYLFGLATAYVRTGRRDEGVQLAEEARRLAVEHEQLQLAAAIERELATLR